LPTPEPPQLPDADRASIESLLRRILALPYRSQLELYAQLTDRLSTVAKPSKARKRIADQQEALTAMQSVAESLSLPDGQAPTTTQFDLQARKLGLAWNVTSVGRALNGYRNAQTAFTTGRVPESARHIRQRQYLKRTGRGADRMDLLEFLRRWQEEDPGGQTPIDYTRWLLDYNSRAAAEGMPLGAVWQTLTRQFPELSFGDLMDVAFGRVTDPTELSRQRAEERLSSEPNPLRLVGVGTASALIGMTTTMFKGAPTKRWLGGLTPVAAIAQFNAFLEEDIRTYQATGVAPPRKLYELNDQLLSAAQVAPLLGYVTGTTLLTASRNGRVLAPEGRYSRVEYWLPASVAAWRATHPDPKPRHYPKP
jgi:hypothetical protein